MNSNMLHVTVRVEVQACSGAGDKLFDRVGARGNSGLQLVVPEDRLEYVATTLCEFTTPLLEKALEDSRVQTEKQQANAQQTDAPAAGDVDPAANPATTVQPADVQQVREAVSAPEQA